MDIPWEDSDVFEWYFSEACDSNIVLPLGEESSLEIIQALASIFFILKRGEVEEAKDLIILLTELIIASNIKDEELIRHLEEKVLLKNFENNFDDFIENL